MTKRSKIMDSFRQGTPKRTMGSETEYTTRITGKLIDRVDDKLVAHDNYDDELWMNNGARLYIDFGKTVEYATPECTSGHQVLLHERIGQMTVRNVGDLSVNESIADPFTGDVIFSERRDSVYKRTGYGEVIIGKGEDTVVKQDDLSTGHHETYQTGLSPDDLELNRAFLDAYLATRIVWSGAGKVTPQGYQLSQKADGIDFNKGDELVAHGMKIPYQHKGDGLVEIRVGEGNMSDWAIVQKFDMTSLVLRLIEHVVIPQDRLISEGFETAAFRGASRDPLATLPSDYELLNAIDIQKLIAQSGLAFAEEHAVPANEIRAAKQVSKACDDIHAYYFGEADLSVIDDRIDWAAKLSKLRSRGISLGEVSCSNLIAVVHDLSWEDISRDGASVRWYRQRQKSVFSESDIRRNAMIPPSERAQRRIDVIESYPGEINLVDWDTVTLRTDETRWI